MALKESAKTAKEILIFSLPIIAGQIGQMLFGIGDMLVAGRYSSVATASIGVAAMIFAPFFMFGLGFLMCTGPLASQNRGENKDDPTLLANAYMVALWAAAFLCLPIFFCELFIDHLNLTPEIVPHVKTYLNITALSIFPAYIFQTTKDYLQAHGRTYAPNIIIIGFNILNVILNIIFMFGLGPIPEMGVKGAAVTTLVGRTLMAVVVFLYAKKHVHIEFRRNNEVIKKFFKIGLPIAFSVLCEVLIFATVSIIVGGMNVIASASQSVVMNITSLTFMVPLALSSAVSILVGEQFGRKNLAGIQRYSSGAILLVFCIQVFLTILYLAIPAPIMGLITNDQEIILYGSALLFWVGIFQIPDGLQVVLSGVMRGLNETKIPMILALFSYWVLGLPMGLFFANQQNYEAKGLWMGLTIGLTCMCILLLFFYQNRLKKLRRLM